MMIAWTSNSKGDAQLIKAVPMADPSGGDSLIWSLEFCLDLNEGNAAAGEGQFPALKKYITRAVDGQNSSTLKVAPRDKNVKLTLSAHESWQQDMFDAEEGEHTDCILPEHGGECRWVKSRLTEDIQTQTAKFLLTGVPAALSNRICRAIGKRVNMIIAVDQQDLPLGVTAGPREGQIVIGRDANGVEVCGLFAEEVGDFVGVDDFGSKSVITEVAAALTLESNDDTPVLAYIEKYKKAAKKGRVTASFAALVQGNSIAAENKNAPAPGVTTIWLNDAVIKAAVSHQREETPPEA